MKKGFTLLTLVLLSACSKINSVEPFDQKQAAILAQQIYGKKTARPIQPPMIAETPYKIK